MTGAFIILPEVSNGTMFCFFIYTAYHKFMPFSVSVRPKGNSNQINDGQINIICQYNIYINDNRLEFSGKKDTINKYK